MKPTFFLTQEQKNFLVKRMPRGFTLCKIEDIPKIRREPVVHFAYQPPENYITKETQPVVPPAVVPELMPIMEQGEIKQDLSGEQDYYPVPAPPRNLFPSPPPPIPQLMQQISSIKSQVSDSFESPPNMLANQSSIFSQASSFNLQRQPSLISQISKASSTVNKPPPVYNLEGTKHKSTQRLRIIVQRFKKHRKFPQLANSLSKLGQVASLSRIEQQIKRNLHTLDSFKQKVVELLNMMREYPAMTELAEEFHVFLNQLVLMGRQEEFEGNLLEIQKSVDRITRDLTEIKEQGQWYVKKKKRNDKALDQKELIYICDLIRQLPKCYMVGVWEIVNEKPFRENKDFKVTEIDFSQLKPRKIREVQYYVKKKLQTIRKSRENKKLKLDQKNRILHPELVNDNLEDAEAEKGQARLQQLQRTPIFQQNMSDVMDLLPQQPENILQNAIEKPPAPQDELFKMQIQDFNPNPQPKPKIELLIEQPPKPSDIPVQANQAAVQPKQQPKQQYPQEVQQPTITVTEPKKQPKLNFDDMIDNSSDSSMITDDEDSLD